MRVRPLVARDLVQLLPLYAAQIAEERAPATVPRYPVVCDDPLSVVSHMLLVELSRRDAPLAVAFGGVPPPPEWFGVVAETETEPPRLIGYMWASLVTRALTQPMTVVRYDVAYVVPLARRRSVARALAAAIWEAAHAVGAHAAEASYIPGSAAAAIWEGAGFRPFKVDAVFADEAWCPHAHAPLARIKPAAKVA